MESIEYCKKALAYDPEYGLAYYKLGDMYASQNNLADAAISYEKAAEYMPIVMDIWQKLVTVYAALGNVNEAQRVEQRAMEIQKAFEEKMKHVQAE
jgi:tetratricopeptide (TPR) repeat protein